MSSTIAHHPTLRVLLGRASGFDAEYGASLSNHLPMALAALARLGASDERLHEFGERYARRLHAAPPLAPWPAGEPWRALLGQPLAWPGYRQLFRDWIEHEGAAGVLAQALPTLMQGVAAAAFHGPIRVAYALAANHADELVDGLAYWASRWFACGVALADQVAEPLGATTAEPAAESAAASTSSSTPEPAPDSVADPLPVLDRASALVAGLRNALQAAPLISLRMALVAAHPRFAATAAALHIDARATLPRLAQLAAERHAAEGDFTVLHLVTSAHAMQVLLPWLDEADRRPALVYYAAAYIAAWATRPRAPTAPHGTPVLPWDDLAARAVASDDDHVIKLVDSARELEAAFGGAVWGHVASCVVV
jgi:Questin oxidase-like